MVISSIEYNININSNNSTKLNTLNSINKK